MDNEKMAILKMLESGKINAAEAARLLSSVETPPVPPPAPPIPPVPPPRPVSYDANRGNNSPGPIPAPLAPPSGRSIEDIAADIGKKAVVFAKDMEPKIQKITETVASKIVGGAERLSRNISDAAAPSPQMSGPRPAPRTAAPGGVVEKNIEMVLADGYNELNLASMNGELRIKGYNGDKITAKLSYKARRANAAIELMKLGGKYYLNYEQDDFEMVSIDAYVPERSFRAVRLENLNGSIDVASIAANDINISNSNGNTKLTGIAAGTLKAESGNGRMALSGIAADKADIENVNGLVEAEETDVAIMRLTNFNGPLSLWVSDFTRYTQYDWTVETGNAKLGMNLPAAPDLGYHIKARAAMGEIRLGLTGLQYLANDPAMAEARSVQFDSAAKQIRLTVETSNGPLTVN